MEKAFSEEKESNFLYYGLLAYTIIFYAQIGTRFPVLAPFRIELVIGSVLIFFASLKLISGKIRFDENRLNTAAVFFLVVAFCTIPFALVKMRAFNTFIQLLKYFAIYLMIIVSIDNEKKLKGFIYVYVIMIGLIFVEPFFLSLQGKGFVYNNHMWRLGGVTALFGHPNALGMITCANLPFFYYFMRREDSIILRIVYLALIIIGLIVIVLTQSRTAFLGVLTFGLILWLSSKNKLIGLIIAILLSVTTWLIVPQETKERFLTLGESTRVILEGRSHFTEEEHVALGSMASRWMLIQRSFIAFKENPMIGLGLNCFQSFNGRRWGLWFPPHNTYLQALAETGTIGAFALIVLIVLTLKNMKQAKQILKETKSKASFLSNIIPAVVGYYWINLVTSFFGIELYANFWWVAGGLSLVILRILKTSEKKTISIT